jgi:hypothetical protein
VRRRLINTSVLRPGCPHGTKTLGESLAFFVFGLVGFFFLASIDSKLHQLMSPCV